MCDRCMGTGKIVYGDDTECREVVVCDCVKAGEFRSECSHDFGDGGYCIYCGVERGWKSLRRSR